MGCPEGMSKIRYTRLALEIWFVTVYFLGKRRSLLHPNTAQQHFFPFMIFLDRKTLGKNAPKGAR